jgi:hypothetical protein
LSAGAPATATLSTAERAGAPPAAAASFRHTPRRARIVLVLKANPRRSKLLSSISDVVGEASEWRLRLVMICDYGY